MHYDAWFRDAETGTGRWSLDEIVYRSPTGGLLEVAHDLEALKHRSAAAWMKLWEGRYKRTQWPFSSGVWGKKELVLPGIPDEHVVSLDEGGSNLFWAERYGREIGVAELWLKLCGNSHTGSFKDLGIDGARVAGQGDDRPGQEDSCRRLRLDRRYFGGTLGLRCRRRHPPERRPAFFLRGYDVYDQNRVGFTEGPQAQRVGTPFDTRQRGNGNQGHVYGADLSAADKDALVEFMKTL